jgi:hypothetical protein
VQGKCGRKEDERKRGRRGLREVGLKGEAAILVVASFLFINFFYFEQVKGKGRYSRID